MEVRGWEERGRTERNGGDCSAKGEGKLKCIRKHIRYKI
jgi:hypothetical protein